MSVKHLSVGILCLLLAVVSFSAFALEPPQHLAGSVSDEIVDLTWSAVDDASGYNVYRDNAYVTTVFDTAWTDALQEGEIAVYNIVAFGGDPVRFSSASESLTLPLSTVPDDPTIPPSVPENLAGSIDGGIVTLHWDASSDDEAVSGYNVYRNNAYLDTVFATHWEGPVVDGERYLFSVVAFDVRQNFSAQSKAILLPASIGSAEPGPPTVPQDLSGRFTVQDELADVELLWSPSEDDAFVLGYNIYLNNRYIDTVFETRYTAQVPADGVYHYSVVAFDNEKQFSAASDPLILPEGLALGPDTERPSAPGELSARIVGVAGENLLLEWAAATDDRGVSGYNVYENNRYLTTVFDTDYLTVIDDREVRSYYIVAFDNAGNFSSRSERITFPDIGNQAPYVPDLPDIIAYAGETLLIDIAPVDVDGPAPGLYIGTLPVGMASDDNFDGTRTLRWRPLQPDVGSYNISVTSIDAIDTALRTTQTFELSIVLPDDPDSIVNLPPVIDLIDPHVVRSGDTVVMEVKASDPNGTVPELVLTNPPDDATFLPHPEFPTIKVLRWTTPDDVSGSHVFDFLASDSVDDTLQVTSSVELEIRDPSYFERTGERLKTLAQASSLQIGYASLLQYYNRPDADLYQSIASEEFDLVTTENSMKWGYVNPEPGSYRWEAADTLMAFASDNGMAVHGHALVWYASLPQWVQQSPIDERETLMLDFIDTMTSRYADVAIWDVVNEAFESDGSYRNSVWFEAMGSSHIGKAFERAHRNVPDAVLIYNDYDIAIPGAKSDAVYSMLQTELAAGTPIDGIGFQMHIDTGFDQADAVADQFERFAALGLDVYITELDVSMLDGDTEQRQAEIFATVTHLCLSEPACRALQFWGISDRYSWLKPYSPLLFDHEYQPKPAYYAVQDALQ